MSDPNAETDSRLRIFLGALLALAGLATMVGWIFHRPAIVQILPGYPMVFSSAFAIAVAGVALICGAFAPALRKPVHTGAGLMLAVLGVLALAQNAGLRIGDIIAIPWSVSWPSASWATPTTRNYFGTTASSAEA